VTDEDAGPVFERGDVVYGDDPFTDGNTARRAFVETTPGDRHRDQRRATGQPVIA
jgi:hypothetical protein